MCKLSDDRTMREHRTGREIVQAAVADHGKGGMQEVATRAGITRQCLDHWLHGVANTMRVANAKRLARATGAPLAAIMVPGVPVCDLGKVEAETPEEG
jgi:DNA-binding phage protein